MTSKKLSKAAQQSKDGDDTSDSLSSATANAILAAIEKQGNDLKRLIEDTKLSINTRLDAVLANVQSEQSGVKKRVEELELAVTNCDSRLEEVEKVCEELRSDNKFLRAKVNDLEGRSRRPNLKFVGIKEGAEQGHPTAFITELISTLFGQDKFPKPVKVDRAHRSCSSLRPKPSNDERSRPIIAKLHRDRDKELILRLSRENAPLHYRGKQVHIFPDYTAEVTSRRRAFGSVLKVLREAGVTCSLLFPARLRVNHKDSISMFDSPEEARKFADSFSAK
ncbi:hypothetical protein cypCar_00040459 [Cyprinus carpio]|nr:hypothetical protein cypCar_00048066 [Cyprinus carpio]KTF92497.1 hypothetical protein cypCar_00040459 [Cyprinus carpio]